MVKAVVPFVVLSKPKKSLQVVMPESPIRNRARASFFAQGETNMVVHLRRNLATVDITVDDPADAVQQPPFVIGNNTYEITYVGLATPKYRWLDVSCSSRAQLEAFLTHYDATLLSGTFTARADMNPILRRAQEMAFCKNAALTLHMNDLALAFDPTIDVAGLITRGLICAVEVF